jgi:hypothetical protein
MTRPAPSPSKYAYSLQVDLNSLPPGVTIHPTQVGNGWWLANDSDRPLILEERFAPDGQLDWGIKLVSGKIYHYYRSGIPMVGKEHLKGWQEVPLHPRLQLAQTPSKINEGRWSADLPEELPPSEAFAIEVNYDGQPHKITGLINYHFNELFDSFQS